MINILDWLSIDMARESGECEMKQGKVNMKPK